MEIDDSLLTNLAAIRSDGNITPFPVMHVTRQVLDGCTVAVVQVEPSDNPPLKYNGRVCIRIGPRRGYATAEEERRLTEKRRWGNLPFDQQPVSGASIRDLDLFRFREECLPAAIPADVLEENGRDIMDQLRAVRYPGDRIGEDIRDHKEISGPLAELLRRLDEIVIANIEVRSDLSGAVQRDRPTYPVVALQELIRNAVIHRTYEGTAAPVMLTWYDDRVEITSPGGPYGSVTIASFGAEGLTDYRNPTLGEAAKAMSFIQRFGSGIPRARGTLARNGNPPPEFRVEPNYVHVTVRAAP